MQTRPAAFFFLVTGRRLLDSFASLQLIEPLLRAVASENYETMTPIQAKAIPPLLEGHDVLGCAQTGTGKTAAFLLPIIQHLVTEPIQGKPVIRALVLTPTRELAAQIGDSFATYAKFVKLHHMTIYGGVSQRPQVTKLRRGIDLLVATPGRLLDLHEQGHIDFNDVEFFVLDEADRMLDMGFIRDIRRVLRMLPDDRQNLLFSATMPDAIVKLASAFLTDPVRVEVDRESMTVERIVQKVMFVAKADKRRLLCHLLNDPEIESAIVFTRTKHGANRVARELARAHIEAGAIHGNKSQGARQRALAAFKAGEIRVLVATDIASRGIDVDGVSHIFNYDLPNIPESYVHRIGRTGRAGREGVAIAFCDENEVAYLYDIEKLTGKELDVVRDQPWHRAPDTPDPPKPGGWRRRGGQHQSGQAQQQKQQEQTDTPHRDRDRSGPRRDGDRSGPHRDGGGAGQPRGKGDGSRPPRRRRRRRNFRGPKQ